MRLENLQVKTRQDQLLVAPVTVDTGDPCRLVVVGHSGSGKSTLLAALTGVSPHIVSGTLDGMPPNDATHGRRLLAVQEASEAFSPYRKVGAQLRDGLSAADADAWMERLSEALTAVGLAVSVLGRYPGELSGGMLKRVLLAGLWAAQPRLLLLDEPTSGVDPTLRREVWKLLDRSTFPLIVATHDWEQAIPLSGAMVVRMEGGRLVDRWQHGSCGGGEA